MKYIVSFEENPDDLIFFEKSSIDLLTDYFQNYVKFNELTPTNLSEIDGFRVIFRNVGPFATSREFYDSLCYLSKFIANGLSMRSADDSLSLSSNPDTAIKLIIICDYFLMESARNTILQEITTQKDGNAPLLSESNCFFFYCKLAQHLDFWSLPNGFPKQLFNKCLANSILLRENVQHFRDAPLHLLTDLLMNPLLCLREREHETFLQNDEFFEFLFSVIETFKHEFLREIPENDEHYQKITQFFGQTRGDLCAIQTNNSEHFVFSHSNRVYRFPTIEDSFWTDFCYAPRKMRLSAVHCSRTSHSYPQQIFEIGCEYEPISEEHNPTVVKEQKRIEQPEILTRATTKERFYLSPTELIISVRAARDSIKENSQIIGLAGRTNRNREFQFGNIPRNGDGDDDEYIGVEYTLQDVRRNVSSVINGIYRISVVQSVNQHVALDWLCLDEEKIYEMTNRDSFSGVMMSYPTKNRLMRKRQCLT